MFKTIQKIHFVGIGGSGMSGIAEVLVNLGYKVTGSDLKQSDVTDRLQGLGAEIFYGHRKQNVGETQVVVTSTAVRKDNPEVKQALKLKIPVIPRIEMLAELARLKYTIAVAGTHGKTTTTSMVATILQESGMDPTFIIGGKLQQLGSGAKLGHGDYLVAEADESDGSFLKLSPTIAIITNIDNDHLDYHGSMKKLKSAFIEFGNRVPFYGCTICCVQDKEVKSILPYLNRQVVTYGFDSGCAYSAQKISFENQHTRFNLFFKKEEVGTISLPLSGKHNVLNALAACVCALELKIPFEKISLSLQKFQSVARRIELRGEKNGALWIDDYGHHPTEIKATLSALREKYKDKRLVVLFQPHRFSRTKILLKEFGKALRDGNEVILLPIYPAGEKPIPGLSSKNLLHVLRRNGVHSTLLNGHQPPMFLEQYCKPDTIFLTLGAGDVWKMGQKIFAPVD
ncbi:MAG: UDP-N-acetylmuramate--L-alanine ligase [Elusimicrobia bacterium RIFCSPLOWO2_02_FULL_39_32]|nr:MAG: UDP-N-acetylmuramate--L-alanine ligase [Elusimicrobia bacterium RIFCSPHIGHO2_02_FULL_39_36]OGR92526.1 MAG: UDP-N-acetylmuramate--L-alanine ligase [Elusimicrobia bacterium RIFCSPLOWO2_02_FULL_39_32]OGR99174.1 MAG: UDP-N-acetylmuramate--L-alanine ligase [Elusimicrobia bacterium RIFCSPLOWO2_12_FULL_39_28]